MFYSHAVWLVPVAISLVSFGAGAAPAAAQTTYTFSTTNYDITSNSLSFAAPDILEGGFEAESINAPFGLTQSKGYRYIKIVDFATGEIISTSDPKTLGLQDKPDGFFSLFGTGNDELFGTISITGIGFPNPTQTFSGPITITGGEGRFTGASGTLFLTGRELQGFSLNGSFTTPTTVPEPSTLPALVMGGAAVLLSRRLLYRGNLREVR